MLVFCSLDKDETPMLTITVTGGWSELFCSRIVDDVSHSGFLTRKDKVHAFFAIIPDVEGAAL